MKKFIALITAGVMLCATTLTAVAATSPSAKAVVASVQEGFKSGYDVAAAAERGLSAGEYYNNAVVSTPGIEKAMPVGQGGKIIINGVATNLTAYLSKVDKGVAEFAKKEAAAISGTVLNVVKVDFPGANFKVATINFYLKGLAEGKKVVAKQYVKGAWINVEVVEVRADHVVLNLSNAGPVAFIEVQ